jgi:bifunctional non-homologous end joining protein LigD
MPSPKPFSFEPMLCESAEHPPEGREWRHELKLDGFRAIGRKSGRSAQLWSRNQKDFTRRFPSVVKGLAGLPSDTVIDGEIVALDETGRPSFNLLQGFGNAQAIVLYAFDLLMLRGKDVRRWPLDDRRDQLREIVPTLPETIRYSETFDVPLPELIGAMKKHHLEGIVAKRAGSQYRSGERSADWLKWRANRGKEFEIGGYALNGNILDTTGPAISCIQTLVKLA